MFFLKSAPAPIISMVGTLFIGFQVTSNINDLFQIVSQGKRGTIQLLGVFSVSVSDISPILFSLITLALILGVLLSLGIFGQSLSGVIGSFRGTVPQRNEDSADSDIASLIYRIVTYAFIAFVCTMIMGLIWMLASLRYPTVAEQNLFLGYLRNMSLLGVGVAIWISSVKGEAGKGAFYLMHTLLTLSLGIALGLYVLPGDIFLPWLIVSIAFSICLYIWMVFYMQSYDIESGCFSSKKVWRPPDLEDKQQRGIWVPICWIVLIAGFVLLERIGDPALNWGLGIGVFVNIVIIGLLAWLKTLLF
jgi:hypothetical protein